MFNRDKHVRDNHVRSSQGYFKINAKTTFDIITLKIAYVLIK